MDTERPDDNTDSMESNCEEKLIGSELLGYVRQASNDRYSVLIEIATPDPSVEFSETTIGGELQLRPKVVLQSSDTEMEQAATGVEEARRSIQSITSLEPNWIDSASVFVVNAKAEEICRIARIAQVRSIKLNAGLNRQ